MEERLIDAAMTLRSSWSLKELMGSDDIQNKTQLFRVIITKMQSLYSRTVKERTPRNNPPSSKPSSTLCYSFRNL